MLRGSGREKKSAKEGPLRHGKNKSSWKLSKEQASKKKVWSTLSMQLISPEDEAKDPTAGLSNTGNAMLAKAVWVAWSERKLNWSTLERVKEETKLQIILSRNFAIKGSREIGQQLERGRTSNAVF